MPTPVLVDLDGVMKYGDKTLPGASKFVQYLVNGDYTACFLSNNTKKPASVLRSFFKERNLDIPFPFQTALDATLQYVENKHDNAIVFADPNAIAIFYKLWEEDKPDCVIMGDMGNEWDFEVVNRIFRYLMDENPPELIAMQKNRFQTGDDGKLELDAGPFVAALEYATSREATLIGKPSPVFFETALKTLGASPDEPFWMLGDDLVSDIEAAQNCGGKTILLLTGKTTLHELEHSEIKPDYVAKNLNEAATILKNNPI